MVLLLMLALMVPVCDGGDVGVGGCGGSALVVVALNCSLSWLVGW